LHLLTNLLSFFSFFLLLIEFLLFFIKQALKKIADVVVAKDGTGKYNTVNAAIAAAPQHSHKRFIIYIKTGIYDEIVAIENTKPNLTLIGDGQESTIITGNLSASNVRRTFYTATFGKSLCSILE
jgi:pectinesterase